MRICWDRFCEKKRLSKRFWILNKRTKFCHKKYACSKSKFDDLFSTFLVVGSFPYWVLCMYRIRLSMIAKINQKPNFSKVEFIGSKGWKGNSMLEIDWLEPKWYLKSLVLMCYIFWEMKTHIWKVLKNRGLCGIHVYQIDFLPQLHMFSTDKLTL